MPTNHVKVGSEMLQEIADSLLKARKIVVVTGAGISTNSGIPDFRSENGLYSLIQAAFEATSKLPAESRIPPNSENIAEPPAKRRKIFAEKDRESYRPLFPGLLQESTNGQEQDQKQGNQTQEQGQGKHGKQEKQEKQEKHEEPEEANNNNAHPSLQLDKTDATDEVDKMDIDQPEKALEAAPDKPKATIVVNGVSGSTQQAEDVTEKGLGESTGTTGEMCERSSVRMKVKTPRKQPPMPTPISRRSTRSSCVSEFTSLPYDIAPSRITARRFAAPHHPPADGSVLKDESTQSPTRRSTRSSRTTEFVVLENHILPSRKRKRASVSSKPSGLPQDSPVTKPPLDGFTTPQLPRILSLSGRNHNQFPQSSSPLSSPPVQSPIAAPSSPLSSPPAMLFDPFTDHSDSTVPTSQETSSREGSPSPSNSSDSSDECHPSSQGMRALTNASNLPRMQGKDLFDQNIWKDPVKTTVFYSFITTLRQKVKEAIPTPSHQFISHLRDRGKLVRCYTQNIDQIEEKVGLTTSLDRGTGFRGRFSRQSSNSQQLQQLLQQSQSDEDMSEQDKTKLEQLEGKFQDRGVECVYLHGSLKALRCFQCHKLSDWDEGDREKTTLSGEQPECPHCAGAAAARTERGKRALGIGRLRPDIVLYGEDHPRSDLISPLVEHDIALCPDLLIIVGTSLRVHGLKFMVREFAKAIHNKKDGKVIFVNLTKPAESVWKDIIDFWVEMNCDDWVADLKERKPAMWAVAATADDIKKKPLSDEMDKPDQLEPEKSEKSEKSEKFENAEKHEKKHQKHENHDKAEKPEPKYPVALRPHKKNNAYLVTNLMDNLAVITGGKRLSDEFPPQPKARRVRKSAPATLSCTPTIESPRQDGQNGQHGQHGESGDLSPQLESDSNNAPAVPQDAEGVKQVKGVEGVEESNPNNVARPRPRKETPIPLPIIAGMNSSIRDAVKSNPRRRKRKIIDGEEVILPRVIPQKRSSLPARFAGQLETGNPPQQNPQTSPNYHVDASKGLLEVTCTAQSRAHGVPIIPPSIPPTDGLLPPSVTSNFGSDGAFFYDDALLLNHLRFHSPLWSGPSAAVHPGSNPDLASIAPFTVNPLRGPGPIRTIPAPQSQLPWLVMPAVKHLSAMNNGRANGGTKRRNLPPAPTSQPQTPLTPTYGRRSIYTPANTPSVLNAGCIPSPSYRSGSGSGPSVSNTRRPVLGTRLSHDWSPNEQLAKETEAAMVLEAMKQGR